MKLIRVIFIFSTIRASWRNYTVGFYLYLWLLQWSSEGRHGSTVLQPRISSELPSGPAMSVRVLRTARRAGESHVPKYTTGGHWRQVGAIIIVISVIINLWIKSIKQSTGISYHSYLYTYVYNYGKNKSLSLSSLHAHYIFICAIVVRTVLTVL